MSAGVLILGLERVRQAEQALEDRSLESPMGFLQIDGIDQRLLVGGAKLVVRAHGLRLARARHLVEILEVPRIRERLRQGYVGRHDRVSGRSASTRARSASGENGLVRYSSAPAPNPLDRSASCPAAVSMTIGVRAKSGSRLSCRQTSRPS